MLAEIPALAADAAFDRRDQTVRVTDRGGRISCELRCDDGFPFVRLQAGPNANQWQALSQKAVFALFEADSPMATFLRQQGVNPLRAGKGWRYEGGIRAPLSIRWLGTIGAGRLITTPTISTDLCPTLLQLAGLPARATQPLDGALGPRSAEYTPDAGADHHRSVTRRAVSTQRPRGAAERCWLLPSGPTIRAA